MPFHLLVDIQAKLRAGKGIAYERWAKKFNLKQAAQTLNYLSEKGITAYDDLNARTEEATARYHALSSQVREQEAAAERDCHAADAHPELSQDPRNVILTIESRLCQEVPCGA